MNNNQSSFWHKLFIEIALRALWKTHLNYIQWELGHQWDILNQKAEPEKLNQSNGIQLADEVTVCSAITQEFISSQLVSGIYHKKQNRFYKIGREVPYKYYDCTDKIEKNKLIDIVIQRYSNTTDSSSFKKVLIEAKRVSGFPTKLFVNENSSKPKITNNIESASDDISKLILINSRYNDLYYYVLIWGYCTNIQDKNLTKGLIGPDYLMSELKKNIRDADLSTKQIRWFPLEWNDYLQCDTEYDGYTKPCVPNGISKWCWVSLIEITPK